MAKYVAFLRGINVGGRVIKMDALRQIFIKAGVKNVKTYIQSGNVIFESSSDPDVIVKKIEKALLNELGYEVPVLLRTVEELEEIIKLNPFKKVKSKYDVKHYVVFFYNEPVTKPKLPLHSPKKDVEVFHIHKTTAFCLSRSMDGKVWGFPNAFIEKEFKMPATTRNWNTVCKVIE